MTEQDTFIKIREDIRFGLERTLKGHKEYGRKIEGVKVSKAQINPNTLEFDVIASLGSIDDKRCLGQVLRNLESCYTVDNRTIRMHQYSPANYRP